MTTSTQYELCLLRDQIPLTHDAYSKTVELRHQVRRWLETRSQTIERMGLDPETHLPQGNWDANHEGLYDYLSTVLEGDYQVINNLRLFSQNYTGYQLYSLADGGKSRQPKSIPLDLDDKLERIMREPAPQHAGILGCYRLLCQQIPEQLQISLPRMFGEIGWIVNGKLVNNDTIVYLERVMLLGLYGKLWQLRNRTESLFSMPQNSPLILEIGSGFGGLAHHLKQLIPEARYICVDIPESLLMSSIYLNALFPEQDNVLIDMENLQDLDRQTPGFTFVPNYLFDKCCGSGHQFDLVINTLSMAEMSEVQVRYYCEGIARSLKKDGVFFEQNQDNRHLGFLETKGIIADYFPFRLPLKSPYWRLWQGEADFWSTTYSEPYAWHPAKKSRGEIFEASVRRLGRKFLRPLRWLR